MEGYNASLALELERSRNRRPVTATLTSAATAQALPNPALGAQARLARIKKAQSLAERGAALVNSQIEKIEFGILAKLGYGLLILLNAIGDILDFALLFGLITEGISLVYDMVLLPINLGFLGMNPKNNKAAGQKRLGKVLIRFLGIENIPVVSMFYLRTIYVVRVYRDRKRAAEEGVSA